MKKSLKIRPNESLSKWVDRIASQLEVSWEIHEAMSEISKTSYIKGSGDAYEIYKNKQIKS